ncbi:unnamed protein product [Linum trigynum]|uniref:Uncharacterized protein n=1 Tax=Linum trigynum TaxID=586398 RepID=A0AAV2CU05_9ROSI
MGPRLLNAERELGRLKCGPRVVQCAWTRAKLQCAWTRAKLQCAWTRAQYAAGLVGWGGLGSASAGRDLGSIYARKLSGLWTWAASLEWIDGRNT